MTDLELAKTYSEQRAYEVLFEAGYFDAAGKPISGERGAEIFGRVGNEWKWSGKSLERKIQRLCAR